MGVVNSPSLEQILPHSRRQHTLRGGASGNIEAIWSMLMLAMHPETEQHYYDILSYDAGISIYFLTVTLNGHNLGMVYYRYSLT